ncbi:LCP family protein [Streptomyces sp. NPDC060194]|uniref:LCP family protein n=1 Tax=Streptomyces sp. NPDC060194 TaxID=3347069 RepID=UPI003658F5F5
MGQERTGGRPTSKPGRPLRGSGSRRRPRPRRRGIRVAAWSAAGLVAVAGTGGGYLYYHFNGNLKGVDINAALGSDRPDDVDNGSMDILLLGSDSRAGANAEYGLDEGGARADTAMVLHVYEGHKKASVVSIPRDTLVTRPDCTAENGQDEPGGTRVMFNTAYQVGGPACAVKTVEQMSGIRMDHYLEVDFSGFKNLIDELGGVDLTLKQPVNDAKSRLDLEAGPHTLDGEQSLALVRTRKAVGDGSDLGRIQLQQAFVKALIAQAKSVGVFSSPTKLYGLADTATKAVTTDSELDSVKSLTSFANGLKDIGGKNLDMVTMPVVYDTSDVNRVVPLEKQSAQVWAALKADRPIPASATKDSAGDKGEAGKVVGS